MSIYMLEVETENDWFYMPFSSEEKAINFIKNNFEHDKPRKIVDDLFEGKNNKYVIKSCAIDQPNF